MNRIVRRLLMGSAVALLLAACSSQTDKDAGTSGAAPEQIDTRAVYQLLDLMDTLVARNPDYEQISASIAKHTGPRRERMMHGMAQRNEEDYDLNVQIDSLLALPAYEMYYERFSNMDSEKHRAIFCALPFYAPKSPADIGSHLYELCLNRDTVRAWVDSVISRIDLQRSQQIALQWLPEGDYSLPTIRLIYDGNGDAFATPDGVCFDLYSIVIAKRPHDIRFQNLCGEGVERIEKVLAHEMQHVYASPYLYPPDRTYDTWQERQMDRLIRRFVSEGVAMQCDVGPGLRRDTMEDSLVVAYWINQLNETVKALRDGTTSEDEFDAWFSQTYHDTARMLLEKYGKRHYPDVPSRQFVVDHITDRPTFVYTLGWWMITHILRQEDGKAKVVGLLSDPASLFELYNQSLDAADSAFVVSKAAAPGNPENHSQLSPN
jgi:hypothetical protein